MTKRMLIDASHAEETRVVVLDGNRLEDFDVETQSRRQLKGNIYLAKVVRVEPSLQAAFVEYGGNRHGFLAFGEIHPDYFQIPVADRQRLIRMQEEEARAEERAEEEESDERSSDEPDPVANGHASQSVDDVQPETSRAMTIDQESVTDGSGEFALQGDDPGDNAPASGSAEAFKPAENADFPIDVEADQEGSVSEAGSQGEEAGGTRVRQVRGSNGSPDLVGGEGDQADDGRPSRSASRFMRSYKIQEVIRRRQILLIQVVKEERGTKGAALTTYISLAGRYCVLMPNSPRGGGISRKITSATDRRRLKEVTAELDIPRGMGLIVRTAGAMRPKPEIKRDGEYLLRLWDDIRETTMQSMAPSLIYEEASLIKRAIRDVYSRDVDELLVDGEDGWRAAREFMRMLMPTHVKKVQLWPQGGQPLFAHQQVEMMLDSMLNPTVQLRSGGYLVINQTEALVAIDVNSGRSTRERGIEETALRTNLEAAEEAARQLRLRDLAGLIVIDFIDMESKKHNAMVERRMSDALRNDRARIQVGHISHFGLMELSRQRLRPSLAETTLTLCEQCGGTGHVRSTESAALHVLREIEEEGGRQRAADIVVHVAGATALYILNHKRQRLGEIEQRYRMQVAFAADETLHAAQTRIDKGRPQTAVEPTRVIEVAPPVLEADPEDDVFVAGPAEAPPAAMDASATSQTMPAATASVDPDAVPGESAEEGEQRRRRRRRRRRGGRRDEAGLQEAAPAPSDGGQPEISAEFGQSVPAVDFNNAPAMHDATILDHAVVDPTPQPNEEAGELNPVPGHDEATEAAVEQTSAKRGRRGGRRRRKPDQTADGSGAPEHYVGPTPADPFAMSGLDIFDAIDGMDSSDNVPVVASAPQPVPALEQAGASPVHVPDAHAAERASGIGITGASDQPENTVAASDSEAAPLTGSNQAEQTPEAADAASMSGEAGINAVDPEPAAPVESSSVQPVLIGAADFSQEKKRGWWRR